LNLYILYGSMQRIWNAKDFPEKVHSNVPEVNSGLLVVVHQLWLPGTWDSAAVLLDTWIHACPSPKPIQCYNNPMPFITLSICKQIQIMRGLTSQHQKKREIHWSYLQKRPHPHKLTSHIRWAVQGFGCQGWQGWAACFRPNTAPSQLPTPSSTSIRMTTVEFATRVDR